MRKTLLSLLAGSVLMVGAVCANAVTIRFVVDTGAGFTNDFTQAFGLSQLNSVNPTPSGPINTTFAPGINIAQYWVNSNQTASPGDTALLAYNYIVRVAIGNSDPLTNPDFVDLHLTGTINPKNYYFFPPVTGAGNGSSLIVGPTLSVGGTTAVSNVPITLTFRTYDELDALANNPDIFSPFAYTTAVVGEASSLTYTVTAAVPEPGVLATLMGPVVIGSLFALRRRTRRS